MRPKWSDLTPEQKALFGNGVGPDWFPDWLRAFITTTASFFFKEASWRMHDFGYYIGKSVTEKFEYDWKFLRAMSRDCRKLKNPFLIVLAVFISIFFYLNVTLFGWFSFSFGEEYSYLP